jgi:hypothetical protein
MKKLLVLLASVAFVVAFTVPAMSADWSFYGSSRMTTFYYDVDPPQGDDDTDLTWDLQGNSRIGANVKAGDVSGRFEYGTGINLRLLYGTWNFGGGSLLVGQSYTPLDYFTSDQVGKADAGLVGYGNPYTGRQPNIALNMANLELALVKPNIAALGDDQDTTLPRLELAYKINLGAAHVKLLLGYQTYDVVEAGNEESLDAYVYGFAFNAPFGPAYFKGSLLLGDNAGNLGLAGGGTAAYANQQITDNDHLSYTLVLGYKASDMISFQAGYGHIEGELDQPGSVKAETDSYYVQAAINIAKGFFVVPEIGIVDVERGDETTYYGAKWQINF